MRELREFRGAYPDFERAGVALAGVSTNTLESHRAWTSRLSLPYPLLADPERRAASALGLVRRIGVLGWSIDLFRRATLLVDVEGKVAAAWTRVRIRSHAEEVLNAARALSRPAPEGPSPPSG